MVLPMLESIVLRVAMLGAVGRNPLETKINLQGYLHAMTLVKREKEAWSGKGDVMTREGNASVSRPPLTTERKKMVQVGALVAAFQEKEVGGPFA